MQWKTKKFSNMQLEERSAIHQQMVDHISPNPMVLVGWVECNETQKIQEDTTIERPSRIIDEGLTVSHHVQARHVLLLTRE